MIAITRVIVCIHHSPIPLIAEVIAVKVVIVALVVVVVIGVMTVAWSQ